MIVPILSGLPDSTLTMISSLPTCAFMTSPLLDRAVSPGERLPDQALPPGPRRIPPTCAGFAAQRDRGFSPGGARHIRQELPAELKPWIYAPMLSPASQPASRRRNSTGPPGLPACWAAAAPVTVTWPEHAAGYTVMKWPHVAAHTRAGIAGAVATITPVLTPVAAGRP